MEARENPRVSVGRAEHYYKQIQREPRNDSSSYSLQSSCPCSRFISAHAGGQQRVAVAERSPLIPTELPHKQDLDHICRKIQLGVRMRIKVNSALLAAIESYKFALSLAVKGRRRAFRWRGSHIVCCVCAQAHNTHNVWTEEILRPFCPSLSFRKTAHGAIKLFTSV